MKFVSVRNAKANLSAYLDKAQQESVVVTAHGKPKCVVIGIEDYDMEEVILMASPNFWKMIEERRRQPKTSLEEFERTLASKEKKARKTQQRYKKAG